MGKFKEGEAYMGTMMAHRGSFNDILGPEDKKSGRIRSVNSCWPFRTFVRDMGMEEVLHKGRR